MNRFDHLPARDALAEALGLTRRSSMATELAPTIGILAGGFVLGAMTALLLAPKAGAELRSELGERVGDLRRRANRASENEPPVLKEL